ALRRCPWCGTDELYVRYHDEEWGVPTHDDRRHFEFLVLESAQAGLSWITILRKRENYRKAYRGFDPAKVARFAAREVERLMGNAGIVRNRAKIEASISNARLFLALQRERGSFDAYLWGWTGGRPVVNRWKALADIPARTELSDAVAKDLKARGFRFLGSTIMYSHLQAVGVVDDHFASCFRARRSRAVRSRADRSGALRPSITLWRGV
ncbi:MAG: DNA-3-methyladenine glycosylase I, partial [Spirochaetes bacterium]|nr:DNA-3-methyladenine glycosylase I [Spirochaetota bacterium]